MNFSKYFLVFIVFSSMHTNVRCNRFERMVAQHPYLAVFGAATIGAVSVYVYKQLPKKPAVNKDDEVKKEAKSLFDTLASLADTPIKKVIAISAATGIVAAAARYGLPSSMPMKDPILSNKIENGA